MKALSWSVFISGTLIAALTGVRLPPMWEWFAVGIVLAVAGAVMLRRQIAASQAAGGDEGGIRDLGGLRRGLDGLVAQTEALGAETDPAALKDGVEQVLMESLMPVVAARLMLAAAHGIETYAMVYTPLASGERCLNRAWSALVDGEPQFAGPQIKAARGHFEAAAGSWPSELGPPKE
jgi:hypothetical protein